MPTLALVLLASHELAAVSVIPIASNPTGNSKCVESSYTCRRFKFKPKDVQDSTERTISDIRRLCRYYRPTTKRYYRLSVLGSLYNSDDAFLMKEEGHRATVDRCRWCWWWQHMITYFLRQHDKMALNLVNELTSVWSRFEIVSITQLEDSNGFCIHSFWILWLSIYVQRRACGTLFSIYILQFHFDVWWGSSSIQVISIYMCCTRTRLSLPPGGGSCNWRRSTVAFGEKHT